VASNREKLTQDSTEAYEVDWKQQEAPLYDMYFEVANLRLGRSGDKPLE
jgi:hypothetical protein